ncbi:hypothetical protein ANN_22368 [Periplaneta americana]|uniref:Uncharacterized protein n=1 Tax=Periplaneta americana TaxID=6978 RepID=A0ABQ8S878_PERAM|nr:hypothetical protein ANN_22368 [Periplaneta americana]
MIDEIKIYGSYAKTKRKAENMKDWRKTCPWAEYVRNVGQRFLTMMNVIVGSSRSVPHVTHLKKPRSFCANFFGERIISQGLWPPRSPDLTSPDLFLWGYLKGRVNKNKPHTLEELQRNITEINNVSVRVLKRVAENMSKERMELEIPKQEFGKVYGSAENNSIQTSVITNLSDNDKIKRRDFRMEMLQRCKEDGFSERLLFNDESTFHISEKINKQNVRIWGTKNPRATVEYVRNSLTVNVF